MQTASSSRGIAVGQQPLVPAERGMVYEHRVAKADESFSDGDAGLRRTPCVSLRKRALSAPPRRSCRIDVRGRPELRRRPADADGGSMVREFGSWTTGARRRGKNSHMRRSVRHRRRHRRDLDPSAEQQFKAAQQDRQLHAACELYNRCASSTMTARTDFELVAVREQQHVERSGVVTSTPGGCFLLRSSFSPGGHPPRHGSGPTPARIRRKMSFTRARVGAT